MKRQYELTWSQRQALLRAQLMPAESIFCTRTMRTRETTLQALVHAGYAEEVHKIAGATWYQLTPAGRAALERATR